MSRHMRSSTILGTGNGSRVSSAAKVFPPPPLGFWLEKLVRKLRVSLSLHPGLRVLRPRPRRGLEM